jgi:hypothetical protein
MSSTISRLGQRLASMPGSQAQVERVFSAAKFTVTQRERLSGENLAMETMIRVNSMQAIFPSE